ncbi:MMPL family transporter [Clostridium cibarium]|uniref:MMPL family transporter n=1 Tax=Clostridium cibarium TaxID=2762247 RepID=A0ABR8PXH6_9CLOT|nr:MMPL family transporter [Clostridium cibarium]MBD7912883.1 MMPL family transporter [Clostridium cibarium]
MFKQIKQKHILSLITWIVILIISLLVMPDISQLVKDKGQNNLPKNVESEIAAQIGKKVTGNEKTSTTEIIAVFHNENKITEEEKNAINSKVEELKDNKETYGIDSITSAKDNKETAEQLISGNNKTELALVTVSSSENLEEAVNKIQKAIKIDGVETYVTGEKILSDEFSNTTEQGIEKTEIIAAIFIFVVLVLVFKSPIVPVISLTTVGVSLVISLSIIMNLAKYFDLPISDFTQVFLVVVLFGVGTDYNILLYDKFKEELSKDQDKIDAAITSRKTAGRTMLYSGLSVFIGFAVLGLAKFSFYQSAVGVAIGVAVLLGVLLTLNMFFMATLGKKMFWPAKEFAGNSSSHLWHGLSKISIARPILMLSLIAIFGGIFMVNNSDKLNFNTADEIADSNPKKEGYLIIQEDFSKGKAAPTTLYIDSDKTLDNQEDLATIDDITEFLKNEKGVKQVLSATQPSGEKIDDLYLKNQLKTVVSGVEDAKRGLEEIKSGLSSANTQLSNAGINENLAKVQQLADGTKELANGSNKLHNSINEYVDGTNQINSGLGELKSGTTPLVDTMNQITSGSNELQEKINTINNEIANLSDINQKISLLLSANPTAGNGDSTSILTQLPNLVGQLNQGYSTLNAALNQVNESLPMFSDGVKKLAEGSEELTSNGSYLREGSKQVNSGVQSANAGVQELNNQLKTLGQQTADLQRGLGSAVSGISTISQGLSTIQSYIKELGDSYIGNKFYVTKSVLADNLLEDSFKAFLSKNRQIAQITVVLTDDPSSSEATEVIKNLQNDIKARVKGTSLEDAKIAFGGQTSETSDLEQISNEDFTRTAIIMLIGIGVALVFVTRSILQPVVIIITLMVAYLSSIGITRLLSGMFLGKDLLTWNAPFFTFIMIIALGVDYSIFLMMRYREESVDSKVPKTLSILNASTVIGAVVISAAIILSGTFAALIPSGVTTLIQVAVGVILGLLVLLIILPITISAYIRLTYIDK